MTTTPNQTIRVRSLSILLFSALLTGCGTGRNLPRIAPTAAISFRPTPLSAFYKNGTDLVGTIVVKNEGKERCDFSIELPNSAGTDPYAVVPSTPPPSFLEPGVPTPIRILLVNPPAAPGPMPPIRMRARWSMKNDEHFPLMTEDTLDVTWAGQPSGSEGTGYLQRKNDDKIFGALFNGAGNPEIRKSQILEVVNTSPYTVNYYAGSGPTTDSCANVGPWVLVEPFGSVSRAALGLQDESVDAPVTACVTDNISGLLMRIPVGFRLK